MRFACKSKRFGDLTVFPHSFMTTCLTVVSARVKVRLKPLRQTVLLLGQRKALITQNDRTIIMPMANHTSDCLINRPCRLLNVPLISCEFLDSETSHISLYIFKPVRNKQNVLRVVPEEPEPDQEFPFSERSLGLSSAEMGVQ